MTCPCCGHRYVFSMRRWKRARVSAGLCVSCPRRVTPPFVTCAHCRDRRNQRRQVARS